ncbi:MAG: GIN domain-containing protein [Flavobacteriales bacterium]
MALRLQNFLIGRYLPVLMALLLPAACSKDNVRDCIKSKGNIKEQLRLLPESIDSVFLGNRMNVEIVLDTANFAIIRSGANLVDLIETRSEGQIVVITDRNKCHWVRDLSHWPEVELHLKDVRIIATRGTNNIHSRHFLNYPQLTLDLWEHNGSVFLPVENQETYIRQHTGASDVTLIGRTEVLRVYMAGMSKGDYSNLTAIDAFIDQRSSGGMQAKVLGNLFVSIFGDGNVTVVGQPEIKKMERIGRGELILK